MRYALILNNAVSEYRDYPEALALEKLKHVAGLPMLRPVVFVPAAGFNGNTHTKALSVVVSDTQVTETEVTTPRPLLQIKAWRKQVFRSEASSLFDTKYDLLTSILVLANQAPAGFATTFKTNIKAIVDAYQAAANAVDAAADATAVLAVTPVWPSL